MIIRAGECGIYNISADNQISNIDLVKKIMCLMSTLNGEIDFIEDRKGHDKKYAASSKKIKGLGWIPQAEFDKELRNTVEWYKNQYSK